MLEKRNFVLYSQPVGIIHLLMRLFETQSEGTYDITNEGRRRSGEGVGEGPVYSRVAKPILPIVNPEIFTCAWFFD